MTLMSITIFIYVICCTAIYGHRCPEYPSLINNLMDHDCSNQLVEVLQVLCSEQSTGTVGSHGRVKRDQAMTNLVCDCCIRSCSVQKLQEYCWLT
uniref:Insulin-like peptide 3 n=1 Tax=Mizuhopecten yessoensis TaxID=6573 RepID=A0A346GAU3_MIZYE|nr:insulin-like peptide 3 [Mizuhopecten yessoensis]